MGDAVRPEWGQFVRGGRRVSAHLRHERRTICADDLPHLRCLAELGGVGEGGGREAWITQA